MLDRHGTSRGGKALNSFFRMAVIASVESAVSLHITAGYNINARDLKSQTPLVITAGLDAFEACSLQLNAGADATSMHPEGKRALNRSLFLIEALRSAAPFNETRRRQATAAHTDEIVAMRAFREPIGAAIVTRHSSVDHVISVRESFFQGNQYT